MQNLPGADVESDHSLVISNIKLKLKIRDKQLSKKQRDVAKLKENDVMVKYVTELKKCLQDVTASSVDERTEQLSSAIRQAVNSSIPEWEHIKKKWITEATLEKNSAEKQRKLVKENSATAKAEYKRKRNEVKAAVRQRKNEWLDKQCHDLEKHHAKHRTREVYKLV